MTFDQDRQAAAISIPPLFALAPRYARDLKQLLDVVGVTHETVVRADGAAAAFARSPTRLALIDLRGALATASLAAHELGAHVAERRGGMLALVARGEAGAVAAAIAAGATHVLASPFGSAELGDALRLVTRTVERLDEALAGRLSTLPADVRRDALTGLATADYAQAWATTLLGDDAAAAPAAIVMLIAVGRFGQINSAYGATVADTLLQAVAERLTRHVADDAGEGDADSEPLETVGTRLVARMAGAEFAVVMPGPVTLADADRLARRIVAACEVPFVAGGRVVYLGVRVGIASGCGGDDADSLFRRAGTALARARSGAPGDIEINTDALDTDPLTRRADLEADLRLAISGDGLDVHFQPQVSLDSGRVAGVEALVRWTHPEFGVLPVETLLDVAAGAEYGTQLGIHIRARALAEAAAWPSALDDLKLALNVTAGDIAASDFLVTLDAALAASGFPRHRLTLEITESDLIANLDAAAATLHAVQASGIRIALDDFGTGYSSLSYLKSLPLDCLKLDRRLTRDLAGNPRDRIIVRGVVELARALGIRVTAEGVETAADLDLVIATRCDCYQGYLCAPALPSDILVTFITDWNARVAALALSG